ncbi:MAG: hypothetical protein AAFR65_07675 [Pseudomonadota bacterium]
MTWKHWDITGRALLLLAVFLQLSVLGATEEAKVDTYRFYALEGQTFTRLALRQMAEGSNEEAIHTLSQASDFLYSNYENRFESNENARWYLQEQRFLYASLFGLASIMLLIARVGELKDQDSPPPQNGQGDR